MIYNEKLNVGGREDEDLGRQSDQHQCISFEIDRLGAVFSTLPRISQREVLGRVIGGMLQGCSTERGLGPTFTGCAAIGGAIAFPACGAQIAFEAEAEVELKMGLMRLP